MVRCSRSTWPLLWGRPARIWLWATPSGSRLANSRRPNSPPLSVSTRSSCQSAACSSRATRWASAEVCSTVGPWLGADDQLRPGEGAVGVDRGDLPDGALGSVEAPDEKAVDADQLARTAGVDVRLRFRGPRRSQGAR